MRRKRLFRTCLWGGGLLLSAGATLGCSDTPLDLIWANQPGGGAPPASGGNTSEAGAGNASGGNAGGQGGEPAQPVDPCVDEGENLFLVQEAVGNRCLRSGPETTVAGELAHTVVAAPCDGSAREVWSLRASSGAYEFRNLAQAANLDIRLAATGDGTSAVLYVPHQLYNQRFFVRGGASLGTELPPGDSRLLAPRHVDSKCLTYVPGATSGEQVQIWPCDELRGDQRWNLTPLVCPE